ncbi:DNA mismatch repair protein MutS [bacterium C-53]|nr:DNA mismatch repair protein MutS [Lachnospiraceae bacterium]NBI04950.1 DNA mismatch repair protein MutS [Lachnospiraceae bacterium]RKJ07558.1 DNA mismatch repair protein MutS [bacterium C-53]
MVQTDKVLEFDKMKEKWIELALTEWAKEKIKDTVPSMSENELIARQRETSEARELLEKSGNPPLVSLSGIRECIQKAAKGDCLSISQLEDMEKSLVAVMRLKNYLSRCKQWEISLAYYDEKLDCLDNLKDTISMQIRNGRIDDNASKDLKSLRDDIERHERGMREKVDAVIRANKESLSDHFSTLRNGHICIPVKKEYKYKIKGNVIDKSSTGGTLFIEPSSVGKYYETLQLLRIHEDNEEYRILYSLSAMVADYEEILEQNISMIEKLDFIFSKGKLSLEYDGVEPKINTQRYIRIEDGRHPLMAPSECVPLQFEIGKSFDGVVITGPNTGGKTVTIKTVALNCMMAQCGLHVACKKAEICMNSNFLCDIGDGQNISENLSTFSAHIVNVLEILKKVNKDSLVVMDELGSGTDPTEGMGIAIAILEELQKSGGLFLVTTHYPEVKQYADKKARIENARMTFDKESLQPLYQLVIGEAGESCAFYIAGKMGMPEEMLKTAMKAAYGKEEISENLKQVVSKNHLEKRRVSGIQKRKRRNEAAQKTLEFQLGDSVLVYPDKKIGIVCKTANEKGVLRVQMADKKIWVNRKRIKLHVAAEKLYPDDYDFSIIFDSVKNRKLRHQMDRGKIIEEQITIDE